MDVDTCVALHNKILWYTYRKSAELFEQHVKTWFDCFGAEVEELRPILSDNLESFLERVYTHNIDRGDVA